MADTKAKKNKKEAAEDAVPEAAATKARVQTGEAKKAKQAEIIAETAPIGDQAPEMSIEAVGEEPKTPAKAGKRSAKAEREQEQKSAKEEKKAEAGEADKKAAKPAKKPTRPKAERAGKKYREAFKLIEKDKSYPLAEALSLVIKTSTTKFDATVELHANLGVDPRQADQNIRGTVSLPAGTGKTLKIAVLAEAEDAKKAKTAGADLAGLDEILGPLEKEQIEFDILISTPALMARLGKYARLLGPRGLMPNPKSGTVATDITAAVKAAAAGRVEYRVDPAGIIHVGIGKTSFGAEKLQQNADAMIASIRAAKPSSLKGTYLKSAYLSSTMGPSVKLAL